MVEHHATAQCDVDGQIMWRFIISYRGKPVVEAFANTLVHAKELAWWTFDTRYVPEMEDFVNSN